jgi:hypothetical protein
MFATSQNNMVKGKMSPCHSSRTRVCTTPRLRIDFFFFFFFLIDNALWEGLKCPLSFTIVLFDVWGVFPIESYNGGIFVG